VVDVVIIMDKAPLKPVRRVKWKSAASGSHHTLILTDDTRVIPSAEEIEFGWILLDAKVLRRGKYYTTRYAATAADIFTSCIERACLLSQ
jgi:hypothetical protein